MSPSSPLSPSRPVRYGFALAVAAGGFVLGEVFASVLVGVIAALQHYPGGVGALSKASEPPWWYVAASLVGLWGGFATAVYVARERAGLAALPEQWRLQASDVKYVVLGVALQLGVDLAYQPWHLRHFNQPVHHLFGGAHGGYAVVIGLMTMVGAPFFEELFFRGLVFRSLRGAFHAGERGFALWAAIVASAVVFAFAHGELAQFAGLAAVGVVLALLVVRTKRLMPSFLTHASFNAVALVALLSQRSH